MNQRPAKATHGVRVQLRHPGDSGPHSEIPTKYFVHPFPETPLVQVRGTIDRGRGGYLHRFFHQFHTLMCGCLDRSGGVIHSPCGHRPTGCRAGVLCYQQDTTTQVGPRTELQLHCAGASPTERTRPTHEQRSTEGQRHARTPPMSDVRDDRGTDRTARRRPDRNWKLPLPYRPHLDDALALQPGRVARNPSAFLIRIHLLVDDRVRVSLHEAVAALLLHEAGWERAS